MFVNIVSIALCKDFDTAAHERLLSKLESYGTTNG